MKRLNHVDMSVLLNERTGMSQTAANEFIKQFSSSIREAILSGRGVRVHKLGTFSLIKRPARKIKTGGKIVDVPERNDVVFTIDDTLKYDVRSIGGMNFKSKRTGMLTI